MKKLMNIRVFLVSIGVLLVGFSSAQVNYDVYMNDSLLQYTKIVINSNPAVKQRYHEYNAALEKAVQAGVLSDPEFTAGIYLTPMELLMGNQVADFTLMQMFPWFGVLSNARQEMSLMAKSSLEVYNDAVLEAVFEMKSSYFDLYTTVKAIEISAGNLELLKTIEHLTLARYRSGVSSSQVISPSQSVNIRSNSSGQQMGSMNSGSSTTSSMNSAQSSTPMTGGMQQSSMSSSGVTGITDLNRLRIEINELENSIELLNDRKRTIVARFNALLNRHPEWPVALPDTMFAGTLALGSGINTDSLLLENRMLSMIKLEQESLKARMLMNKRMGYPMIGVGVSYSILAQNEMVEADMNGRDMVMPMFKMTIPVWRKKYKSLQKEVIAQQDVAQAQYELTINSLRSELFEAVQLYNDSRRRINLYGTQSELANQSLKMMISSYSGAVSPLSELLEVHRQLLNYKLLLVQAVADCNTSIAMIHRLSGHLTAPLP